MNRKRILSTVAFTVALLLVAVLSYRDRSATWASQPNADAGDDKDTMAQQIKELQKQLADLKAHVGEPCIVAAGTATWTCPATQRNDTSTRVKLPRDVVVGLGKDYIVLLTNRFPGGYPYFDPYWKLAPDGFDITLVDSTVSETMASSYGNRNRTYLVDWIVVKK